jgi:aminodeoxychorismate synthase component I
LRSPIAPSTPVTGLPWQDAPADVFAGLHHLDEPIFLDTSGNLPRDAPAPLSLIAAEPTAIFKGSLRSPTDLASLEDHVASHALPAANHPFPLGGLFGSIDYEGDYHFGSYRNILVYDHLAQTWWEVGEPGLSQKRQRQDNSAEPTFGPWKSNLTADEFQRKVQQAQQYIAAGDVYQINLAQRFRASVNGSSLWPTYCRLRKASPAPMAAYLRTSDGGGREILSSSPELFLKFSGRRVQTRPIKGTRPRFIDPAADIRSSHELRTSEKERAELLMITDLLRNDLGRVCDFGTVQVDALARLESLAQVHHLVSTVSGSLRKEVTQLAALASCSPGGSITGAPKKRATEIISELEPDARGFYTGSIGYLGYNGESQFNIAIRTLIREGDRAHYHVGSGIVADSEAVAEYEETLHKAKGLRAAIE